MNTDRAIVPAGRGTCPVCGVPLAGEVRACERCDTQAHPDCWDWAGGCAIYGCGAVPAAPRPGRGLLEERPGPAAPHQLVIQAGVVRGWFDPVPGALTPCWWTLATLLAPLGGIGFLVVPALPFVLSRVRWRFDSGARAFEYSVTVAGLPVSRRRIPLSDVARLEVRDDEVNLRLVLVLSDGTSLELSPDVSSDPLAWRRVRALAHGVQVHTGIHVTSALLMDPTTCEKRLIALKVGHGQVAVRARFMARVSSVTAGALAVVMVTSGTMPWALPALALLAAGHLGRRAMDGAAAADSPFLRDGLVRPSALPELERQVQALQVGRASAGAYAFGSAALVAAAWFWSGTAGGPIALVMAAMGSAVSAARWAGSGALGRLLATAEMGRDERPPDAVSAELQRDVDRVRRGMLVEQTGTRVSELHWEIAVRRRAGYQIFLLFFSLIAFAMAAGIPGTIAMIVELLAGVTALYSLFISANLVRWGLSGRSIADAEAELAALMNERLTLSEREDADHRGNPQLPG